MMLKSRHDPAGAKKWITRAIERDPDYTEARLSLGILEADAGDWHAADTHFQHAAESDPKCYPAVINAAVSSLRVGRHDQAELRARQALRLRPLSAVANFVIAAVLHAEHRLTPDAEEQLQKAANELPVAEELLQAIARERTASK